MHHLYSSNLAISCMQHIWLNCVSHILSVYWL